MNGFSVGTSSEVTVSVVYRQMVCRYNTSVLLRQPNDGFGGLVVNMLASGTRVRGFDPTAEAVGVFRCGKNPQSMPSFGGEVKYVSHVHSFAGM
jgi:hypothetical protein